MDKEANPFKEIYENIGNTYDILKTGLRSTVKAQNKLLAEELKNRPCPGTIRDDLPKCTENKKCDYCKMKEALINGC